MKRYTKRSKKSSSIKRKKRSSKRWRLKKSKYIRRRKILKTVKQGARQTFHTLSGNPPVGPPSTTPLAALGSNNMVDIFSVLPSISQGTGENNRKGNQIYVHYAECDIVIAPCAGFGGGGAILNPWALGETSYRADAFAYVPGGIMFQEVLAVKDRTGPQQADILAALQAFWGVGGIMPTNSQAAVLNDPHLRCLDPHSCGFFVKRAKVKRPQTIMQIVNGVTFWAVTGQKNEGSVRYRLRMRNKVINYQNDTAVIPDSQIPYLMVTNFQPTNFFATQTWRCTFSDM